MKEKNKESRRSNETSNLETVLGIVSGFGSAIWHQVDIYNLMNKAGLYERNELGSYTRVNEWPVISSTLACLALLYSGLYVGGKVGNLINNFRGPNT